MTFAPVSMVTVPQVLKWPAPMELGAFFPFVASTLVTVFLIVTVPQELSTYPLPMPAASFPPVAFTVPPFTVILPQEL